MSDRIFERASREFAHFVAELNDSRPDRFGVAEAVVPWSHRAVRFTRNEVPQLIDQVVKVLMARAVFAENADTPDWAVPLPLGDDIPPLLRCEFPAKSLPGLCCGMVWHPEALSPRLRDEILGLGFPPELWLVT